MLVSEPGSSGSDSSTLGPRSKGGRVSVMREWLRRAADTRRAYGLPVTLTVTEGLPDAAMPTAGPGNGALRGSAEVGTGAGAGAVSGAMGVHLRSGRCRVEHRPGRGCPAGWQLSWSFQGAGRLGLLVTAGRRERWCGVGRCSAVGARSRFSPRPAMAGCAGPCPRGGSSLWPWVRK